jgi:hypothetical protein
LCGPGLIAEPKMHFHNFPFSRNFVRNVEKYTHSRKTSSSPIVISSKNSIL